MPHMRFFIDAPLTTADVELSGEEFFHLKKVMRADKGSSVELINGKGSLAQGIIYSLEKSHALIKITTHVFSPKPKQSIILYQAMPKLPHLHLIIEKCTELGVDEIVLFDSSHSEKKGLSRQQQERIEHITIAAIKQSGRLYLPKVQEGSLKELPKNGHCFYGDIGSREKLTQSIEKSELTQDLVFINGPEKGFSKADLSDLKQHNAIGISLSDNILRTETAAIFAVGLLALSIVYPRGG
ncbi:MAG: 16S rRNA (uracil(1498)-N(3))-methyltransferase [Simkaniaceae bacterium]|nr:16S rRNA (uracil(1498)-N(3))-methyltransferase [Simkaniaceae bacterium]MCF7852033.1 16S rRNA (uracil(1498)-N(3))-methyltransferase [Simkaniaceae bacterium]